MIAPESFRDNIEQYIENYIQTRVAKIIGTAHEVDVIAKGRRKKFPFA